MSPRTLAAAAVPIGAVIRLHHTDVTAARVINADPLPGWLTLRDTDGHDWHLGGSERVNVVSLP